MTEGGSGTGLEPTKIVTEDKEKEQSEPTKTVTEDKGKKKYGKIPRSQTR